MLKRRGVRPLLKVLQDWTSSGAAAVAQQQAVQANSGCAGAGVQGDVIYTSGHTLPRLLKIHKLADKVEGLANAGGDRL